MSTAEQVMELVKTLPEDLQSEVADFARFLKESRIALKRTKFRFDWAGAGRHLRDKFTSVELQHKTLDWWSDDIPGRKTPVQILEQADNAP